MISLKKYNSTNFFKHTFCEFQQVDDFNFPDKINYKSKSESSYFYTDEGVYRKSNHWGRVANCRWSLIANDAYKNQQEVIGFAKWTDFYPTNSTEKIFFIAVDFACESAKIQIANTNQNAFLFSFSEAQKRKKQIHQLFKNDAWLQYYDSNIVMLKKEVIRALTSSNRSLVEIKTKL